MVSVEPPGVRVRGDITHIKLWMFKTPVPFYLVLFVISGLKCDSWDFFFILLASFFLMGDILKVKCIDSKLPPHCRIPVAAGAEEDG